MDVGEGREHDCRTQEVERLRRLSRGRGSFVFIIDEIRKQGNPQFKVYPAGQRKQYSFITYLEPFNKRNQRAFGYDIYSESIRKEAMARARDSGTTALSGKVTLVKKSRRMCKREF